MLHRTSFDDAEVCEFQEEQDLRHEFIGVESQPIQVKRRRLLAKTNPINTGYPSTALLTRAVYKVQMEQKGKVIRQNGHDKRVAANEAIAPLARHHFSQQEPEEVNVVRRSEPLQKPHPSHDIATLAGNDGIIWCRRCSSWSKNTKLKCLAKLCEGLKDSNKAQLRLLQVGIAPYAGVRMPKYLSRTFERGIRRW